MSILSNLFRRSAARRSYAQLMQLDDHLLRDIGLNRSDLRSMMGGARTAPSRRVRGHE